MNALQKRALARKIYKEIQGYIDEWNNFDFVKIHWKENGDDDLAAKLRNVA